MRYGGPIGLKCEFCRTDYLAAKFENKLTISDSQILSALISAYLREMGAKPELFEVMSLNKSDEFFTPSNEQLIDLGITTAKEFFDFKLISRDDKIVASAAAWHMVRGSQTVGKVEFECMKREENFMLASFFGWPNSRSRSVDYIKKFTVSIHNDIEKDYYNNKYKVFPEGDLLAIMAIETRDVLQLSEKSGII